MAFNFKEEVPSSSCGCAREYLAAPCQHPLCAEMDSRNGIIYRHVNSPGHPPARSGIFGYDMHDNISQGHIAPCALQVRLSSMFSICDCRDCEENNGEYYAYPTMGTTIGSAGETQVLQWVFTTCTKAKQFSGCGYTHGIVTLEAAITGFGQTEYDIEMHCRLYQGHNATVTTTPSHHRKTKVGRLSNYGSDFRCKDFPQTSLNTYVTGADIRCTAPTILVQPAGGGNFLSPPFDEYSGNVRAGEAYYAGRCLEDGETLAPVHPPHQTVSNGDPWYQSMHVGNYTRDVTIHIAGTENGGGVSGIYPCNECTRLDGAHMLLEDAAGSPQSDASRGYVKMFKDYDFIPQTPLTASSGNWNKLCCGTCDRPFASSICIQGLHFTLASGVQTLSIFGKHDPFFGVPTVMARYERNMPADIMYWNTLTGFTYKDAGITNPLKNQCNLKNLTITAVNMSPPANNIAFHCLPKFKNNIWEGGASPDAINVTFPPGHWIQNVYKDIKIKPFFSTPGICVGWETTAGYCEYDRLDCGYPSVGGGPEGGVILTRGYFETTDDCKVDNRCPGIATYKFLSGNTTNACEYMAVEATLGFPFVGFWALNFFKCRTMAGITLPDYPTYGIVVYVRWPQWHQQYDALCSTAPCGVAGRVDPRGCQPFINDPYAGVFPQATCKRNLFWGWIDSGLSYCGSSLLINPDAWTAKLYPCSVTNSELPFTYSFDRNTFCDAVAGWSSLGTPITAGTA